MRKFTLSLSVISFVLLMMMATSFNLQAQNETSEEPIITFKTNIYNNSGSANQFSMVFGTVDEGNIIEIDTGFGREKYEVNPATVDEENGGISGTFVSCTVSSEGVVKIYGDGSKIDYFNASGCYIETIDFPTLENLVILDLSHNELKSIDLSTQTKLQALYLSDNTFTKETPLVIGYKPELSILEVSIVDWFDPQFNLSDYPKMMSFDGYHCVSLTNIDPSGCPSLYRLTLDVTNVESVDVSNNPELLILNVSETKVSSVDVSKNPKLRELYCSHRGAYNNEYKLTTLDVSNNPDLIYLVCSGNKLTNLDVTNNPGLLLLNVSDNYLSDIDLSVNKSLYQVFLNLNCMDFATLPENPGTWNTYYYSQRPMSGDKSYPVSQELDFSSRVLREGTTTSVEMYAVSESNLTEHVKLDDSYFTYSDGKVTLNKVYADSVYISFSNSLLNENALVTERFMIKNESEYGQPSKVFGMSVATPPNENLSFSVGIDGASEENPIEFFVNFGDGVKETFTATSSRITDQPNVSGIKKDYGQVEIYTPEGVTVTALGVEDVQMYSVDVTKLASLRQLRLTNTGLYFIDLNWNRCLESLDLSHNLLSSLSLESKYAGYGKNVLTDINLSHNQLTEVVLNDLTIVRHLDLSHNRLSEAINFYNGDAIEDINLSNNEFTSLDFSYCRALRNLDVSFNQLEDIILPQEDFVVEYFACNNNKFKLSTLPEHNGLTEDQYEYAPQSDLVIATKGPGADLTEQQRDYNGSNTVFIWKKESGEVLVEGVDYNVVNGIVSFTKTDLGNVYCEMTHVAYPDFEGEKVFKTTLMEVAGMPTNEIASFTTVNDDDEVELSLASAKPGTAIYIDWNGNNTVTQYLLEDTYQLFYAKTKANADVKVYTYEPTDAVTVFSMTGAKLSSFDGSKLTDAVNISVCGAGLSKISLPEGSNKLQEMSLEDNNFRQFDPSKYPSLRTLAIGGNRLSTVDLSENKNLELFSATGNGLSSITFDNDKLWALYIDNNSFSEIDLSEVPNLEQFTISNNYLSSIDVEKLSKLKMLVINNNYFTFETLPLPKSSYVRYYYYNQFPMEISSEDGIVDLSSQSMVADTPTVYRWFVELPELDEDGELVGNELTEGEDYTLENGVTTFHSDFNNVICFMTNEIFPDALIYTYLINVTADVESLEQGRSLIYADSGNIVAEVAEDGVPIRVYGINGALLHSSKSVVGHNVVTGLESGIYIVKVGEKTVKIVLR